MEKSTRELEWFDLEIRTRELIHQQLDPVLSKAREDREVCLNLKNYCAKLEKRVNELEISVLGDKPQETVIANLYDLCATIEGNRKKDCVRIDQEIENIHEKIKAVNFSIERAHEEIVCIHTKEVTTEDELLKIKHLIDDNKNTIIEEIANLDNRFKEIYQTYRDITLKAEEKSVLAMNKAQTNTLEMGNYKREVENIRKYNLETLTLVREIKANKLEEAEYIQSMGKIEAKFLDINESLGFIKDEIHHRDRFIDKFIPLQTATMISDYLHFILDIPHRKRLAEYESSVLQDLNNQTISSEPIDTRENKVIKILEEMKHMEERKVKLLTDVKLKADVEEEKQAKKKKVPKKNEKNEEPSIQPLFGHTGPDLAEVEKIVEKKIFLLQNSLQKNIQEEISFKQEQNKSYFKALIEENNALLNQVIKDFEENSKMLSKENSSILKEMNSMKFTFEDLKKAAKNSEIVLANLIKLVVVLVENAQIEQALEAQDEEDRHMMVQNCEKELQSDLAITKPRGSPEPYSSALPSGLGIQKKCLGCGNNSSLISGFRTTIMYKPTPLMYRNKKFERPLLINFRGKMLKDCWESVSASIP